jgi:hypothetical protein
MQNLAGYVLLVAGRANFLSRRRSKMLVSAVEGGPVETGCRQGAPNFSNTKEDTMKRNESGANSGPTAGLSRRNLLGGSAGAAALGVLGWPQSASAQQAAAWNQGQLAHLIPTASHDRFLIKASFKSPLTFTPRLSIGGKSIDGVNTSCGSPIPAARRYAMPGR